MRCLRQDVRDNSESLFASVVHAKGLLPARGRGLALLHKHVLRDTRRREGSSREVTGHPYTLLAYKHLRLECTVVQAHRCSMCCDNGCVTDTQ